MCLFIWGHQKRSENWKRRVRRPKRALALKHQRDGPHRRGNGQKSQIQGAGQILRTSNKLAPRRISSSCDQISSIQLYFRNASDGSEDDQDDDDSDYGAMAEQLEGFLGDDADNDEESNDRPEECI